MSTTIFTADDGVHGRELWRTDGTATGTFMIADLTPGSGGSFASSSGSVGVTNPFVGVPGHVFFTRNDGTHGTELWATDGTASGTGLVADIASGSAGSSPTNLTSAAGKLFFSANDGSGGGAEPWVSDGTAAGTIRLAASGALAPRDFTAFNGKVYFDANNGDSGSSAFARGQIWVTDGTAAGTTTLIASIMPQATDASVAFLANAAGGLVFVASDGASGGGSVLGFSDGTSTGTTTFALQAPDGGRVFPSSSFAVVGGLVYFGTQTANANGSTYTYQIWISDGTQAGTHAVADAGTVPTLFSAGGKVYFTNYDAAHGAELWTVDTTGAHLVSDLTPGTGGSNPANFFDYGGRLVFSASGGYGISDGTAAGTSYFDPAGTFPSVLQSDGLRYLRPEIGTVGGKLLLGLDDLTHGYEVVASDGTRAGTALVDDINTSVNHAYSIATSSTSFRIPYPSPNGLIFIGNDPAHGDEPWITDGTVAGTHLLADLTTGPVGTGFRTVSNIGSYAFGFQSLPNGTVFFDGFNLYRSDDLSLSNASLLYGFSTNGSSQLYANLTPGNLTAYNGSVYFQASDATHSPRLWTSDGTVAGTHQVFDPAAGTSGPINPTDISVVGNRLVFESVSLPDATYQAGPLWASDGTAAGTQKIRDGNFHKIGQLGQSLLLIGTDAVVSGGTTTYGPSQIYVSDGTQAGTLPILSSLENYGRYASRSQKVVGDRLVFDFNDGVHGDELWSTDGTATGTQLIADISAGSQSTGFSPFVGDGAGHLLFTAGPNGSALNQLWTTDGTAAGTRLLNGSFPTASFTVWNGHIYYTTGTALYQADATGANSVLLRNMFVSSFLASTDRLYFIGDDSSGNGRELWASDGTPGGTTRLTDSYTPNTSQPQSFTALLSAAGEPVAPPSVRLSNDTGASASDAYTRDASLTIAPSRSGDALAYTVDGNPTGAYDPTSLGQGRHTVSIVEMDGSGRSSDPATVVFTLDTQRSTATGIVPATSGPTSATTLTETVTFSEAVTGLDTGDFTVTGTNGATATVASVTATATPGVYTVGLTGVAGTGSLQLVLRNDGTIQDIAGNTLVDGLTGPPVSVDHSAPPSTATLSVDGTGDGVVNAAEAVAVAFTVTGLDPNARAAATFTDGIRTRTVQVAANGTGSVDLSGFDGSVSSSLVVTDSAGTAGSVAGNTIQADTTAPAPPGVTLARDTGSSATDHLTGDPTIAYTPSAAGDTLLYRVDGGAPSTTAPRFATNGTADGSHTVSVTETDAASNVSVATVLAFILDTTAPRAPSLVLVDDTGPSASDHVTGDARIAVTAAEAGGSLSYAVDGGPATPAYDPGGLAPGAHAVSVTQTDDAGNASPLASLSFVLEGGTLAARPDTATGSGLAPALTGNVLANDGGSGLHVAAVQSGGGPSHTVAATGPTQIAGPNGILTITADGAYSYQATAAGHAVFVETVADAAGNTAQTTLTLDVDHALTPAFRFFNAATGDHLFTADAGEAAQVRASLPNYHAEGASWSTPDRGTDTVDVFRFFDTRTGDHLYTASTAERDALMQGGLGYRYEGVAFEAYAAEGAGTQVLERFFNGTTGQHHYALAAEASAIHQGLAGPGWIDEGRAFVVHAPVGDLHL